MGASIKNILIGLFVLCAIGIVVFMLLFLHPTVGDNAKTLRVRFTDIDKVNVGTRVTFAGRPVGEVVSIEEVADARAGRLNQLGDVYVYELVLKVDSGVSVYNTDEIILRTSGLLGERNVEISPEPLKPGQKLEIIEDQIIYAAQPGSVETTLKQFEVLSKKADLVLDDLHDILANFKKQEIVEKISHSAQNIVEITDALNQPDIWKKTLNNVVTFTDDLKNSWPTVDHTLNNIYSLTNRAHQSWTTLDEVLANFHQVSNRFDPTWTTVDQAMLRFKDSANNVYALTDKANQIIDYTSQGRGTLGQLFMGDDLYLRLKSVFNKGSTVMDDMSQYGVLFHLDKRWQRLQARRLRLLEKLSNPEEFSRYFNNEMDQISSSLSRVSTVLNESDNYPQSLIYNPGFVQRFSELLKRVENMEESLKMYNEQIVDQQ